MVEKALPNSGELEQLRQLRNQLGASKLARELDIPFYAVRSMLDVERVSLRVLQRMRDQLPDVVARHIDDKPAQPTASIVNALPEQGMQMVDRTTMDRLVRLSPYVSVLRLAAALGVRRATLRAATSGYRLMRSETLGRLRAGLDELLSPPHERLRESLSAPSEAAIRALRSGALAPIPGLDAATTERLLAKPYS